METQKRGRGRPRINTDLMDNQLSRRAAVNAKYMYDGMVLIKAAATKIPDWQILWNEDRSAKTAISKNGILEQLGRMDEQDHFHPDDCVFFANKAIDALKAGYTSREVEKALRAIRMAVKRADDAPEGSKEKENVGRVIHDLICMG